MIYMDGKAILNAIIALILYIVFAIIYFVILAYIVKFSGNLVFGADSVDAASGCLAAAIITAGTVIAGGKGVFSD